MPGYVAVPSILLCNPAYPVLPNVMKEYNQCTEAKHVLLKNKLRATRNQIECTFGQLKSRWKKLNIAVDEELNFAVKLVYACLHNFCMHACICMYVYKIFVNVTEQKYSMKL